MKRQMLVQGNTKKCPRPAEMLQIVIVQARRFNCSVNCISTHIYRLLHGIGAQLLRKAERFRWIDGTQDVIKALLLPRSLERMRVVRVRGGGGRLPPRAGHPDG